MEMTDSVNATTQLMDDSELAQDPFPLYAQWREAGPYSTRSPRRATRYGS